MSHREVPDEVLSALPDVDWHYSVLSHDNNIGLDVIEAQPDCWDMTTICSSRPISMAVIRSRPDIAWDFQALGNNPAITWEDIAANLELPWDVQTVCYNPNVTLEVVVTNPWFPWDYVALSYNSAITWKDVTSRPELPWCWFAVSTKPGVDWDFVVANKSYQWNFSALSKAEGFTWNILVAMLDCPWEVCHLASNPTLLDTKEEAHKMLGAARKIQRWWKNIYYHPDYSTGGLARAKAHFAMHLSLPA